jgi:hypothetical protein
MEGFSYLPEKEEAIDRMGLCNQEPARASGAVAIPLKRNATLGNFPTSTTVIFWQSAICHLQSAISTLKWS